MSSLKMNKVFVYGTLKTGQPNHYWLTTPTNGISKFVSTGRTTDIFPLVIATRYNLPMLLNRKGIGHQISGEIYEVDEEMFGKLDILEQYPNYYDRVIQDIVTDDGDVIPCWMYLIRTFNESLLSKRMLTSYSNTDKLPYSERYYTDDEKAKDEIIEDMPIELPTCKACV